MQKLAIADSMFLSPCWRQDINGIRPFMGRGGWAGLHTEAVFFNFQDVAALGQAVAQSRGHFSVSENPSSFAEVELCSDDDASALAKLTQQIEPQCPAQSAKRQVSPFIQVHQI